MSENKEFDWNDGKLENWGVGKNDIAWMHGCTKIIQSCNHEAMKPLLTNNQ
jgi:hypothetical protein